MGRTILDPVTSVWNKLGEGQLGNATYCNQASEQSGSKEDF